MSNSADFEIHRAEIESYPDEKSKRCTIPIAIYFAEAEALWKVCSEDRDILTKAGLDWMRTERLPTLTGAAREAQSLWISERFNHKDALIAWDEKEVEVIEHKEDCLHDFTYAFRFDSHLMGRVEAIVEGSGDADLVQDLNDIAVLGRENPEPLTVINFDMSKLERAAVMADEMADLLATKESSSDISESRVIRDKAFSLLKEVVDEVYACGQYCFWKDSERKRLYASAYKRAKNRRNYRERKAKENAV